MAKTWRGAEEPEIIVLRRERLTVLKDQGWAVGKFTAPRKHGRPLAGVVRFAGCNSWMLSGPVWDHAYCLKHRASGRVTYVGEPYNLGDRELRQIAELRAQGWDVAVLPRWALHYPGHTVAVWVRDPEQPDPDNLEDA